MNEKKDAHSHYVAAGICPTVDRLAGLHGGIRSVAVFGDGIDVDFGDYSSASVTGPEDFVLKTPKLSGLIELGERMKEPPNVPVDGLTVASSRLGLAQLLVNRCDDAESQEEEFSAIDLAAELAKLSHETLTS